MQAAADDHQEVVEVMRHAAGQLAERIELLRFRKMLLHLLELKLGFAAFGDVAGDLGEADQPAVLMDRINDDARPEERAVLADAPTFFLITPLFPGGPKRACRLAIGTVGLGVETRKMLTQDFLGGVALDALSPDIPARDDAGGVQHIESIVGDTFDEEAETALALEEVA